MENQPVVAPQPPQYANRKVKYYHTHKGDPGFRERLAEASRNYYERNRDVVKQKALDRYYRLKQLAQQALVNTLSPAV